MAGLIPARALVDLRWLAGPVPVEPRVRAVARFDVVRDQWPAEAWSVVLFAPPGGFRRRGVVEASMLVAEAPRGLLKPGAAFALLAGPTVIARAVVVPPGSP